MKLFWTVAAVVFIVICGACLTGDQTLVPALGAIVTAGLSPKALLEKRGQCIAQAKELLRKAKAENRDFAPEERLQWEQILDDADAYRDAADDIYEKARAYDQSKYRGSAFMYDRKPYDWKSTSPAGRVLFKDDSGQDIRAYAHDEPMTDEEPLSVGKLLYAQLTGRMDTLEPHEIVALGSGAGGSGYLLTPQYSQSIIDLARSASVCMRAGAMTVSMNGEELKLVKLLSDPTSHWRHPGNTIEASNMTFGMLTLTARTLACIIPVYIEWLEDARNGPQIIENAIRNAMALKLDQAALYGIGTAAEPRGILNEPLINEVSSVGTPTDYTEVSQAVGDILNANYSGDLGNLAWVLHPRDGETLDQLTDQDGNPLRKTPWVEKLRQLHTTSLPTTDGSGSNESSQIVGDFSQVVFGVRSRMIIQAFQAGNVTDEDGQSHNAVSEMKYLIRAYLRADVGVLRPTWLTKLTGVTNT